MKFCYDICIGAKHLEIYHPKAGDNALYVAREYKGKDLKEGRSQLILFEDGIQNLTGLANNGMVLVESFLRENELV
jgi:hypothetical protein